MDQITIKEQYQFLREWVGSTARLGDGRRVGVYKFNDGSYMLVTIRVLEDWEYRTPCDQPKNNFILQQLPECFIGIKSSGLRELCTFVLISPETFRVLDQLFKREDFSSLPINDASLITSILKPGEGKYSKA